MLKHSLLLSLLLFFFVFAYSQTEKPDILRLMKNVKSIPTLYTTGYKYKKTNKSRFEGLDSAYVHVVKLDTNAIPTLMNYLSDTTTTSIANTCLGGYFTFGQLAFFLINDIEHLPYFTVTGSQWDVLGECGTVPDGFLNYVKTKGLEFQNEYRVYFHSQARQDWISSIRQFRKN